MAFAGLSKPRLAAATSLAVLALVALPASAQTTTDLALTFKTSSATSPSTVALNPGASTTLSATVTRPEITAARPLSLTLSFTLPADSSFGSFSDNCVAPTDADPKVNPVVCTIKDPFPFDSTANAFGNSVTATIRVARKTPKTIPTSCPTGTLGTVAVAVTSDATDPNPANDSGSVELTYKPYADIGVVASAPASGSIGGTIEVKGTVTNDGPCTAPNVVVSDENAAAAGDNWLTFKSGTGACSSPSDTGDCTVGDLAVGASASFSKVYTVDPVTTRGGNTAVSQGDSTHRNSGFTIASDISDPNGANDTADTTTVVPQSSSGCSSVAGALGLAPLLGLALALSLLRRSTRRTKT